MKIKILFFTFFLVSYASIFAQDIIITNENDSISCKIQSFNDEKIVFSTFENNSYSQKHLKTTEISDTIFNFYIQTISETEILNRLHTHTILTINNDTIYCNLIQKRSTYLVIAEIINNKKIYKAIPRNIVIDINKIPKEPNGPKNAFELGVNCGFGNRLVSNSNYLYLGYIPLFDNKPIFKGDLAVIYASYYFRHHYGIGIQYINYHTVYQEDIHNIMDILISFWGIKTSYVYYPVNNKIKIGSHLGIGLVNYKEDQRNQKDAYLTKGQSIGATVNISFTYFIIKNLGINANAGFLGSRIKNLETEFNGEITSVEFNNKKGIGLNQLHFSAGLVLKL